MIDARDVWPTAPGNGQPIDDRPEVGLSDPTPARPEPWGATSPGTAHRRHERRSVVEPVASLGLGAGEVLGSGVFQNGNGEQTGVVTGREGTCERRRDLVIANEEALLVETFPPHP